MTHVVLSPLSLSPRALVPRYTNPKTVSFLSFLCCRRRGQRQRSFSSWSWTKRRDYLWSGRASSVVGPRFRQRSVFGSVPNPLSIFLLRRRPPPLPPVLPCSPGVTNFPSPPPLSFTPAAIRTIGSRRHFSPFRQWQERTISTGWTWAASRARLGGTNPLGPRWSRPRGAQESPESSAIPPITGVIIPMLDQPPITPQPPRTTLTVSPNHIFF